MRLDKVSSRFDKGKATAKRTAIVQIEFVLQHVRILRDGTGRVKADLEQWHRNLKAGNDVPEYAYSRIDDAYERVMSQLTGEKRITRHHDARRSLRY